MPTTSASQDRLVRLGKKTAHIGWSDRIRPLVVTLGQRSVAAWYTRSWPDKWPLSVPNSKFNPKHTNAPKVGRGSRAQRRVPTGEARSELFEQQPIADPALGEVGVAVAEGRHGVCDTAAWTACPNVKAVYPSPRRPRRTKHHVSRVNRRFSL